MKQVVFFILMTIFSIIPLISKDISLKQAIDLAHETSIVSENASLQLQKQFNQTQINLYLPDISISLGGTATGSLIPSSYGADITPIANISFSLSNTNKYTHDEQELLYRLAQQTYTSTIHSLDSQVTTAYWNVVATNLALQIQELELQNKQTNLEKTIAKYEGGLVTILEVSQAELAILDAQLALQQQEHAVESAEQLLESLISTSVGGTTDELLQPKALKQVESLLELVTHTTSAKTLELNVEKTKLAYIQEKHASSSPTLSFDVSTTLSGTFAIGGSQLKDTTSLSVSLSLPLDSYLPKSRTKITLKNLDNDITIAENNFEEGIKTLKLNVKDSYLALEQARSSLLYLENYKTVAGKNHELTKTAYEAGEVDYATLKESEYALITASLAILSQQVNYTLALYDLSFILETDITTLLK